MNLRLFGHVLHKAKIGDIGMDKAKKNRNLDIDRGQLMIEVLSLYCAFSLNVLQLPQLM